MKEYLAATSKIFDIRLQHSTVVVPQIDRIYEFI